jgi:hypothetical protein
MDYSVLDIFSKDKFILRSEARKLQFPFIRYNGSNYEELVSFITSFSPNTIVPAPEKLKIGELYTFSGKKFQFRHVPIGNLRYAIASNPFIVLPEGDCLPLALEYQQAVDYLKENRHHKLFAYEDILATYKYNPEHTSFMMYDRSHPKGVVLDELPKFIDWYIGGDDDANHLWSCFKVVYKTALHMVDARPDFEDLVDIIDGERYAINQSLYVQGRPIMFNVNWEDNARRKALKHTCHHIHDLKSFIGALYKIIFEDTKGASQSPKESLGEFAGESIVRIIEELHLYYGTGQKSSAPMDSDWPFTIDQIIQMYLQHNLGPQEPEDYSQLQQGILIDFHDYLVKIKESIREKMKIIGTLCQDDYGNIYCGKALVDQRYRCYCGCECVITSYSRNVNDELPQFPYYTDRLYRVALNRTGIISRDEEGTLYLDKYVLRDSAANQLGKEAQVRGIRPFFIPRGEYLGEVVEYVLTEELEIMRSPQKPQKTNIVSNPYHYEIPGDIFDKNRRVADDTLHLDALFDTITTGKNSFRDFQKLVDFVLKWGKIEDTAEQKAMLTLLTGYNYPDAAKTVKWCCDDYMPRVLYYVVKYISRSRKKYRPLEKVDFYSNKENQTQSIRVDVDSIRDGSNPSAIINNGIPVEVARALYGLYPSLFPKPKEI